MKIICLLNSNAEVPTPKGVVSVVDAVAEVTDEVGGWLIANDPPEG